MELSFRLQGLPVELGSTREMGCAEMNVVVVNRAGVWCGNYSPDGGEKAGNIREGKSKKPIRRVLSDDCRSDGGDGS